MSPKSNQAIHSAQVSSSKSTAAGISTAKIPAPPDFRQKSNGNFPKESPPMQPTTRRRNRSLSSANRDKATPIPPFSGQRSRPAPISPVLSKSKPKAHGSSAKRSACRDEKQPLSQFQSANRQLNLKTPARLLPNSKMMPRLQRQSPLNPKPPLSRKQNPSQKRNKPPQLRRAALL